VIYVLQQKAHGHTKHKEDMHMKIRYELTGKARKDLVKAIEKITGEKAVYMKLPTYNFVIGDYTVTKDGTVINEDPYSLQHIVPLLKEDGFEPVGDYEDEPTEETTTETATTEGKTEAIEAGTTETEAEPADDLSLTVEIPLEHVAVGNLTKLLDAKGDLIKKALGIDDLPIEIKEDRVAFPWFKEVEPDEAMAYTKFISALCKMAKEAKRVTASAKETDNEKYTFRCFLLRLGFIGDEYKTDRKILLKNLSGSSAFRHGTPGKED